MAAEGLRWKVGQTEKAAKMAAAIRLGSSSYQLIEKILALASTVMRHSTLAGC